MLRDKGGYKENRLIENLHDCDYMTLLMAKKKIEGPGNSQMMSILESTVILSRKFSYQIMGFD